MMKSGRRRIFQIVCHIEKERGRGGTGQKVELKMFIKKRMRQAKKETKIRWGKKFEIEKKLGKISENEKKKTNKKVPTQFIYTSEGEWELDWKLK